MEGRESLREIENLRFRFQMNNRLRLECLAAVSKAFREFGEPLTDELLGGIVFALPQELITSNGNGYAHAEQGVASEEWKAGAPPEAPPDGPPKPGPGGPPKPGAPPDGPPKPGAPPDGPPKPGPGGPPKPGAPPDGPPKPPKPGAPPDAPKNQYAS